MGGSNNLKLQPSFQASKLQPSFQASYTWIPTPMGSYTISSRFKLLKGFNTQFLQEWIPQPRSKIGQIQNKVRMTHKGALKDMQVEI